jgi:hypothetical protein
LTEYVFTYSVFGFGISKHLPQGDLERHEFLSCISGSSPLIAFVRFDMDFAVIQPSSPHKAFVRGGMLIRGVVFSSPHRAFFRGTKHKIGRAHPSPHEAFFRRAMGKQKNTSGNTVASFT